MQQQISRQTLTGLLDEHFSSYLASETYEVTDIDPERLLTSNHLDVAIKILYLQLAAVEHVSFARDLYISHIKAFSLGSYKEPGNENKIGMQKYLDDFDDIFRSISEQGFDSATSLVPRSSGGSIANGSHRVASAYVANIPVPTVRLPVPDDSYDARFFLQRGMSRDQVETAVTSFIEYAGNCYIALIWPSAQGKDREVLNSIPDVIYNSAVSLNYNGAHNLITQIYYGEPWLGERRENFPGARNKLAECFRTSGQLRVVAFQAESLGKVQAIKDEIRKLFDIGKHSIHISDTREEAIRVARILFNPNSLHFLNYGKPNKFPATIDKINRFKEFMTRNNMAAETTLVDSSFVLSLYGLRESKDIDYLAIDSKIVYQDDSIEDHTAELENHQQHGNELILNNKFYFYYEDLKFVSFEQLYRMKKNRGEAKDVNDLSIMSALIENNPLKSFLGLMRQRAYYINAKLKLRAMQLLRLIGLYKLARFIYRLLTGKHGR